MDISFGLATQIKKRGDPKVAPLAYAQPEGRTYATSKQG